MNEFMKTLLSLSVSGTLLLLLILGLKQLYINKFSRRWQYYILLYMDNCCITFFASFYSRHYDCWRPGPALNTVPVVSYCLAEFEHVIIHV